MVCGSATAPASGAISSSAPSPSRSHSAGEPSDATGTHMRQATSIVGGTGRGAGGWLASPPPLPIVGDGPVGLPSLPQPASMPADKDTTKKKALIMETRKLHTGRL